jgi:glycosyltransferase involved in cell wall biosynthesis
MCPDLTTGILTHRDVTSLAVDFGPPDVVHVATQGPFGAAGHMFARNRSIPCTSFCHTNWPAYVQAYLGTPYAIFGRTYEKWFLSRCAILFCHTNATAARLNRDANSPAIVLLSQFLDTMRFPIFQGSKPLKTRSKLSLVYVGRLAREKSVHKLLQYADYPGIAIHVVGDGPLAAKLERMYVKAHFHGCLDGASLRSVIRESDFLVLPSRTETLGLVVLEAAACGTPSILIRGEVPSDIVQQHDAGIVFDSLDEPDWLDAARNTRNSAHYDVLLKGCRSMAMSHTADIGTERMLNVWLRPFES